MDVVDLNNSLNNAETTLGKLFLMLGHSSLEPLKNVYEGLTPDERDAQIAALIAGCGTKIRRSNEPATDPSGRWLISAKSAAKPQPQPRTIPLYIPLSTKLTEPTEITYAKAVAAHLSSKCGRAVEVDELEGLFLYLWSEDDPDGRALDDYLGDNHRPLQALLLQIRNLEGQAENLMSAELLAFVGQRFEILAGR